MGSLGVEVVDMWPQETFRHAVQAKFALLGWRASIDEVMDALARGGWRGVDVTDVMATLDDCPAAWYDGSYWNLDQELLDGSLEQRVIRHLSAVAHSVPPSELPTLVGADLPVGQQELRIRAIRALGSTRSFSDGSLGVRVRRWLPERVLPSVEHIPLVPGERRLLSGPLGGLDWTTTRRRVSRSLRSDDLHHLSIRVREGEECHEARVVPLKLGSRFGLACWRASTGSNPYTLSDEGWWLWPAGDRDLLANPAKLLYPQEGDSESLRGAVFTEDANELAAFVTRLLARWSQGVISRCHLDVNYQRSSSSLASAHYFHLREEVRDDRPVLGRCRACHQPLTVPESVERGVGPECWSKLLGQDGNRERTRDVLDALEHNKTVWLHTREHSDWVEELLWDSDVSRL